MFEWMYRTLAHFTLLGDFAPFLLRHTLGERRREGPSAARRLSKK